MTAVLLQRPLLGKYRLEGTILVETGILIGSSKDNLDIGGVDKYVVRDPLTQYPYLPGSSIKGKLRSILERHLGKQLNRPGGSGIYRYESDDLVSGYSIKGEIPFEGARTCQVSRLFGSTGAQECWVPKTIANNESLEFKEEDPPKIIDNNECVKIKGRNCPARLIVRDCHLLPESATKLKAIDTGLYMTELKAENGIDRITAAANPRFFERVPRGAKFNFELIYTVENESQARQDIENLAIALAILEDDALGGHGSRGYGKIRFTDFKLFFRNINWYRNPTKEQESSILSGIKGTEDLLTNLPNLALVSSNNGEQSHTS